MPAINLNPGVAALDERPIDRPDEPALGTEEKPVRHRYKTLLWTVVVILSNVFGNYALTVGLRRVGSLISRSPLAYIQALFDPFVAVGVILLVIWLLSHMVLLSWADLSYVLPVTSLGYVFAALIGHFLLNEDVSNGHWTGIVLIVLGVFLVGRTDAHSAGTQ